MTRISILRGLGLLGLSILSIISAPLAATFIVDSPNDSHDALPGDGIAGDHTDPGLSFITLRAALEEANALPGPDTILIPTEILTVRLSLGALEIEDNATTIRGLGGYPTIDAVYNPVNHPTLVIVSDSNTVSGLTFRRARGDAIVITGADNLLGGSSATDRVILVDNGIDNISAAAVLISGAGACNNRVAGCHIGMFNDGMTQAPNRHGLVIDGPAHANLVGGTEDSARNLFSGNLGYGIVLSHGAYANTIQNNFVGADSTGNYAAGNRAGGVLIATGANNILIGGDGLGPGNLISGNQGHGIELTGSEVTACTINGNLIGTNADGTAYLSNEGDGIRLSEGAHANLLGGEADTSGNLVSGNSGSGIHLVGPDVSHNVISANWIGIALNGYAPLGNGWESGDGILLEDGPAFNFIGGFSAAERNVVSGNYRYGIQMTGEATSSNSVYGNYVGTNASGSSSLGNIAGVVLADGAHANTIGGIAPEYGNVISGNYAGEFPYGCGVLIFGRGTDNNRVAANFIGLDAQGIRARRNGSAGVIVGGGAQYNTIGGQAGVTGNVISGNGYNEPIYGTAGGVHIYGTGTSFNRIEGNVIGLDRAAEVFFANAGHGVGLYSGASSNRIGGETAAQANIIGGNKGAGVYVDGAETRSNLIRRNQIFNNTGLGIDNDHGAQDDLLPPTITSVATLFNPGERLVQGVGAPAEAIVDIYEVLSPDPSGSGEGDTFLAATLADINGNFQLYLPEAPAGPITLTATVTDSDQNTSEFAVNHPTGEVSDVENGSDVLPLEFNLYQNYPNPFNPNTRIVFDLPEAGDVRLAVFNALGQRIRTLIDRPLSTGRHAVAWDGRDEDLRPVASGVYFYRLTADRYSAGRKMILLK
jgi:hypothetical protein